MSAPRILIVDDQRDISRMLRVALETLGRGYVIVDVPSGEEAILEVRRGSVDLLIADVRLPGISGLEVIKRLRKVNPRARVIVISALSDTQAQAEAQALGATFFPKPISLDLFLKSVQQALGEKPGERPAGPVDEQPAISDRLSKLRQDLGANAVFLADLDGKIMVRAGDVVRLDMEAVLTHLTTAFNASMKLCKVLGGLIPTNVHFFDGDDYDIYSANVGQYFALVIIFDGDRGAGQMGPVMRYGRQCADDLLNSLVMMGVSMEEAPQPSVTSAAPAPGRVAVPQPSPAAPSPTPKPQTPPLPAKPAPQPEAAPRPLSAQELRQLDEAAQKVTSAEAASFWDTALAEAEATDIRPDTLSWEQAEKLGLVLPRSGK